VTITNSERSQYSNTGNVALASKFGPFKDTSPSHLDIKVSMKRLEDMIPAEELSRLDEQVSIHHRSRKKLL
jgi:hypothetical protein